MSNREPDPPRNAVSLPVPGAQRHVFDDARAHLHRAQCLRDELHEGWGVLGAADPWRLEVVKADAGTWRIDVTCEWPAALAEKLDAAGEKFAVEVKAAMDAAVLAAARVVCAALWEPPPDLHCMVLADTAAAFATRHAQGMFPGLRPDQVRLLETFQPFADGSPFLREVGYQLRHLTALLHQDPARRRLAVWAASAQPEAYAGDTRLAGLQDPLDGLMDPTHTVVTFHVPSEFDGEPVSANPNVGFDLVFNAPPHPRSHEDNLSARTSRLLDITAMLIDALERSVSTMPLGGGALLEDLLPVEQSSPWLPVVFDSDAERARVAIGLAESPYRLASYRNERGDLTLLRFESDTTGTAAPSGEPDRIVGRELPQASIVNPAEAFGTATENAALDAAQAWGLPDFVYPSHARTKGSGRREIGDGTIVSGVKGLALQVKAREAPTQDPATETRWLTKKAKAAARQAAGTVRTFLDQPAVELTNLRDRSITFDGTKVAWVAVVILDHPHPPANLALTTNTRVPTVVVLRRDWEFLWDQLRAASAVVDYFHRVASATADRAALGEEPLRYLELAHADLAAEPEFTPWMLRAGLAPSSGPTLPLEPASTADTTGHALFRHILDDIANTTFDGPESIRLDNLARLDRYAVTERAALGRALIGWLDDCLVTPADQTRWQHRTMFLDHGRLHLAFSVCSTLTGYHMEVHRNWLMLRRHQLLQQLGEDDVAPGDGDLPWTVGVLLTPRPDATRLWDTTIAATNARPDFEPGQLESLVGVFGPLGTEGIQAS